MMKNKIFYGWMIVAIATLALVVSNGLAIGGIPVFYKPIQTDLVATGAVAADRVQTVFGLAPALTGLLAGFLSPVGGFLLPRFGARRLMLAGGAILGAGLVVYSQAASPLTVYLAHALMGTSLGFVGVIVSTVLVSNWFTRKRGTALGIVLTGTSFGGVLIPLAATPLITDFGWRTALVLLSLIIWVILLPAVVFLVRDLPVELGLRPDGDAAPLDADAAITTLSPKAGMRFEAALATPMFWVFSLAAALVFYAIFVVSQQLNLYLQSPPIGFSAAAAGRVQSLLFGCAIAGKFLFGWLADRFEGRRVMIFAAATMFLSTLAFFALDERTVYPFAVLFGLNYGGTFVLLQLLVVEYFGLRDYGKILGAVTVVETIGGALGNYLTGRIADADGGDYTRAFYGVVGAAALALLLVVFLNLFAGKMRRPVRVLPVVLTPLVGALVGVIAGPLLTEIFRVATGAEVSLVGPLIALGFAGGLLVGLRLRKRVPPAPVRFEMRAEDVKS